MYLLDSNVISELVRLQPEPIVETYVLSLSKDQVFTSSICEAEIRYGLAKMAPGRLRRSLEARIDALFAASFAKKVLSFDRACAQAFGDIRRSCEQRGRPVALFDAMIAAVAHVHCATLVTRNVRHFAHCGIAVIDPWQPQP